jgi:hypothetical protein
MSETEQCKYFLFIRNRLQNQLAENGFISTFKMFKGWEIRRFYIVYVWNNLPTLSHASFYMCGFYYLGLKKHTHTQNHNSNWKKTFETFVFSLSGNKNLHRNYWDGIYLLLCLDLMILILQKTNNSVFFLW